MPIKSDREYRAMTMEVKSADENLDERLVQGYATTFDSPYELYRTNEYIVREQVDSHAFDDCDMEDVIFQYDHEGRVFARRSNGTLDLIPDEHGLLVEADLGGTTIGKQLYEEIKGGYTTKMSFGFIVSDDTVTEMKEDGQNIILRTIKKISKLFDVSAVSLPANDQTAISARNFSDGVISEIEAERLKVQEIENRKRMLAMKAKYSERN